jgi:peptidoglycan hydrolase CwlO-like protein
MQRCMTISRGVLLPALAAALVTGLVLAPASHGDLNQRAQSLQQAIQSETGQIQAYQGKLSDLRARLAGLENSLAIQRNLLFSIQSNLDAATQRLATLKRKLIVGRRRLAAQLVAQYEAPTPDIVTVVMESHGFTDLLERVDQMRRLAAANARVITLVTREQIEVRREKRRLAVDQARQKRVVSALVVERDQVASIRLTLLKREHVAVADRAHEQAELSKVRHQLAVLAAQAAAAQQASFAQPVSGGVTVATGGFVPHGGEYGFFPAPGTNYSVGEEPLIAARLDALGKALHLHLIGLSGYRTPQHSVEVGGFADDPHTRGEASDTPGVEGVPESTLLQFGLTRPFAGAAEADHIQLA